MCKLIAILSLVLFLVSCEAPQKKEGICVVTSFYPLYIFTLNVIEGVNEVKLHNMSDFSTGCLHDYQLLPNDVKLLSGADLFITNGLGMESFLNFSAKFMGNLKIKEVSEGVELINGSDPHVWLSVKNAICQVKNICRFLSELDPVHANEYRENTQKYVDRLKKLDLNLAQQLAFVKDEKFVFFHPSFCYFAKAYGLEVVAVLDNESNLQLSSCDISSMIKTINKEKISGLFAEEQSVNTAASVISAETGVKIYTLDCFVSGEDVKDAYESAMLKNKESILKAFSKLK